MILVAGGTGRLGAELVPRLVAAGQQVRVLTRERTRAAHLAGVEVVVGDVRQPHDLIAAVHGVTAVVAAVHGFAGPGRVTPTSVDRDGNANLMSAATEVDARYVLMSVIGASSSHPLQLFRMKAAAEEALRHSSLSWTIVRAGAFLELYQDLLRRTAGRSGRLVVFGRGDNPIQFSTVSEVATAVERALADPREARAVTEVGGPSRTMNQLATTVGSELDRIVGPARHVPRVVLRTLASAPSTQPGRQAQAALVMDTCDLATGRPARRRH